MSRNPHVSRSLTSQLTMTVVLVTALILAGAGAYRYNRDARSMESALKRELDVVANCLAESLTEPLFNYADSTIRAICLATMERREIAGISVDTGNGEYVHFSRDADGKAIQKSPTIVEGQSLVAEVPIRKGGSIIGRVRVIMTREYLDESLNYVLYFSVITIVVLEIALVTALMLILKMRFVQPLQRLVAAATAMGKGAEAEELSMNPNPTDEIGQLTASFVRMRAAIQDQISRIRDSEENLRTTLNSIGDAVIATDIDGNVTRMNPVAEKLTGWPMAEALGQPLKDVFRIVSSVDGSELVNPVEKVSATESVVALSADALLVGRDGRKCEIADSGAPILDADGTMVGVVLVFRDVSEENALQDQLRHSQKMEAIGQLVGGIAHDFNNMIGGIMGSAQLLGRRIGDDARSRKYHAMIVETARRAAELTDKLLTFARKQTPVFVPVDFRHTVDDTVDLLRSSIDRRIKVVVDWQAEANVVLGDSSILQSVLLNLGINASHAMAKGGTITFAARNVELDERYCQSSPFRLQPGQYLEAEVRDTGCGIPRDQLSRIFEPFFTTKSQGEGTGLGLAAVYGSVQQHHGAISVYSEVEQGTTFRVYLPVSDEEASQHVTAAQVISGSGNILVVDDEEIMRETAKDILEDLGYTVDTAINGNAALDYFKEHMDKVDLVVLDMLMPEMNGRDCFVEMKRINPHVKVLLSSGFTCEEDLEVMTQAGLKGFIRKPFLAAAFSQAVHQAMHS